MFHVAHTEHQYSSVIKTITLLTKCFFQKQKHIEFIYILKERVVIPTSKCAEALYNIKNVSVCGYVLVAHTGCQVLKQNWLPFSYKCAFPCLSLNMYKHHQM